MKRTLIILASVGISLLGACTSDSKLPSPTGKGSIRAINAIKGSPEIGFLIEERLLAGVAYKNSTSPYEYDDFSYDINFEVSFPGDSSFTRVATQNVKVEADTDHILLLTGDINAPTVTAWNAASRDFDGSETVFEARFAHANAALGDIDVYFDDPTIVPGMNPPAATLSFGQMADAADFVAGDYVMTITAANDLGTVYFSSPETSLPAQFAHVITIYEGDLDDTGPVLVRSMTGSGAGLTIVDANYPSQTRIVHGAGTLPTVDVYDDDMLTSLVHAGLDFTGATPYFDSPESETTYYFTPTTSTATILFEQIIFPPAPGSYAHIFTVGDTDSWVGIRTTPARAPLSTSARIRFYHAALNHGIFDVYVLDRDAPLTEDDTPSLFFALFGAPAPIINIPAGDVDIYITAAAEKTVLAGPFPFDATLGASIELLVVDTIGDPSTVQITDITTP